MMAKLTWCLVVLAAAALVAGEPEPDHHHGRGYYQRPYSYRQRRPYGSHGSSSGHGSIGLGSSLAHGSAGIGSVGLQGGKFGGRGSSVGVGSAHLGVHGSTGVGSTLHGGKLGGHLHLPSGGVGSAHLGGKVSGHVPSAGVGSAHLGVHGTAGVGSIHHGGKLRGPGVKSHH